MKVSTKIIWTLVMGILLYIGMVAHHDVWKVCLSIFTLLALYFTMRFAEASKKTMILVILFCGIGVGQVSIIVRQAIKSKNLCAICEINVNNKEECAECKNKGLCPTGTSVAVILNGHKEAIVSLVNFCSGVCEGFDIQTAKAETAKEYKRVECKHRSNNPADRAVRGGKITHFYSYEDAGTEPGCYFIPNEQIASNAKGSVNKWGKASSVNYRYITLWIVMFSLIVTTIFTRNPQQVFLEAPVQRRQKLLPGK